MVTYKLHLIRHGITQGNLEGKYIGRTDLDLCEEGKNELFELLKTKEYPQVQKVYSSPMKRCVQTSQILFEDKYIQTVDGLKEYDFGDFEGKTLLELKDNPYFLKWMESGTQEAPPNGEEKANFDLRLVEAVDFIIKDMMANSITSAAVVAHGGVFMNILASLCMPKRKPLQWTVGNGRGYTIATSAQMWSRDKILEVYDSLPYNDEQTSVMRGYESLSVD